jgi:hypothetical protein
VTSAETEQALFPDDDVVFDLFGPRAAGVRQVVIAPPQPLAGRPSLGHSPLPAPSASAADGTGQPAVQSDDAASPTTTIVRVIFVLWLSFALALLLGARGIVHAGKGMPEGMERTVTLAVGDAALQAAQRVGLTRPWDVAEKALGRTPDQTASPLLAGAPTPAASTPPRAPQSSVARITPAFHHETRKARTVKTPKHHTGVRRPTRAFPLRLLVTGDSLTEYLTAALVNDASAAGPVLGFEDTHYGTGLARPDFVDWSVLARQQVASDHPDATVVMMGGNDFQGMTLASGQVLEPFTAAWIREYQRRAEVCMRIWTQGGKKRVYWLSIPPARDAAWARADADMNLALRRAAAQVPGARYLNILGPVTDHGRYADFVTEHNGQTVLVRTADGVHLTQEGSAIVADEVLRVLRRAWHF